MVAAEGSNNRCPISKDDFVVGVGREETLEERNSRVEDDSSLNSGLDADFDFAIVDDVATHTLNVGGRATVKVGRTKERTELVRLGLKSSNLSICCPCTTREYDICLSQSGRLSVGCSIGVGILVEAVTVTVTDEDDDT